MAAPTVPVVGAPSKVADAGDDLPVAPTIFSPPEQAREAAIRATASRRRDLAAFDFTGSLTRREGCSGSRDSSVPRTPSNTRKARENQLIDPDLGLDDIGVVASGACGLVVAIGRVVGLCGYAAPHGRSPYPATDRTAAGDRRDPWAARTPDAGAPRSCAYRSASATACRPLGHHLGDDGLLCRTGGTSPFMASALPRAHAARAPSCAPTSRAPRRVAGA
jgi:hypothetical protein